MSTSCHVLKLHNYYDQSLPFTEVWEFQIVQDMMSRSGNRKCGDGVWSGSQCPASSSHCASWTIRQAKRYSPKLPRSPLSPIPVNVITTPLPTHHLNLDPNSECRPRCNDEAGTNQPPSSDATSQPTGTVSISTTHHLPLHSSHKKKRHLDTLFEKLAYSTSKSRERRIQQAIAMDDPIKLSLAAKLDEVTESQPTELRPRSPLSTIQPANVITTPLSARHLNLNPSSEYSLEVQPPLSNTAAGTLPSISMRTTHFLPLNKKKRHLDTLFEKLAYSTSKSRERRIQQAITMDDPVKLSLLAKLDVTESQPAELSRQETCTPVPQDTNINFYEVDKELRDIEWKMLAKQERCRQPVAWLLEQHYFLPIQSHRTRSKCVYS